MSLKILVLWLKYGLPNPIPCPIPLPCYPNVFTEFAGNGVNHKETAVILHFKATY